MVEFSSQILKATRTELRGDFAAVHQLGVRSRVFGAGSEDIENTVRDECGLSVSNGLISTY